jgi:chemotaxis protein histidine kinase CheA
MKDEVVALGGSIVISSREKLGTKIEIMVP